MILLRLPGAGAELVCMIIALEPEPPAGAAVVAAVEVAGVAVVTGVPREPDLPPVCLTLSHLLRHNSSVSKLLLFPSHPL